jgi:isopentenyldiphosphate isomerase
METLIINIPDKKSIIVKQILKELGVTIQEKQRINTDYIDKIAKVSTWTEDDLKSIEDAKKAFEDLKTLQW